MSGRVGRTAIVYFASQAIASLAGFLATWFIANQLGSTVLGEYSVIVALLFWLNIPASAIGTSMNKRISETEETESYIGGGHLLNAAVTLALCIGILLFSNQINSLANGREVSIFLAMLIASQSLFDLSVESLRGIKRVGQSGMLKTAERSLRSVFQIGIVVASAGFVWLIIGHSLSLFITAVVGLVLLQRSPSVPSSENIGRLVEYAKYSWLGSMKTRAFGWMDTIVMAVFAWTGLTGVVVTHGQIGVYEAAWSLASTLSLLSVSISQTLFPEVSDLSADKNYTRIRNLLQDGLAFTGLFGIPGLVGAALLGGELLSIYGSDFARGRWILVILIGARLFSSYNSQLVNIINGIDRPDITFRINMLFLVTNLILNFGLVSIFGWYGAAVATMSSALIVLLVSNVALSRIIGQVPYPKRPILTQLLAAILMGFIVEGSGSVLPSNTYFVLFRVFLGAAVYGIALFGISDTFNQKVKQALW
jgi:O-antigen/teichoic acid export membrane protein